MGVCILMFLIDKELCTGCGQCVDVCPADAIMLQDAKAVINQSLCRQCGICVDQCPVQAISESVPTYATQQPEQREVLPQQQPGIFSQVLDMAGRLFVKNSPGGSGRGGGRSGSSGRGGGRSGGRSGGSGRGGGRGGGKGKRAR